MDLYQPSGVGKRKKRSDSLGQVEYFYPVGPARSSSSGLEVRGGRLTVKDRVTSEAKNNATSAASKNKHGQSANIQDNVGLTVIIPGGI